MNKGSAPSKSAAAVLEHIRQGGRAYVATQLRVWMLDSKVLARFEKAGARLLWEDGEGYRMAQGRSSVYLFPGQLKID